MENISYKYLNFISFEDIESWSAYSILGSKLSFSEKYTSSKIGTFLFRNKTKVQIQDNILYLRPTIRINGQGVAIRDEKYGKEIGTKNQFRIKKGQFLLSKIDARNGAFGVVPEELDNGIITGNFWTFDVDSTKIISQYLVLITKTNKFQKLSQTISVGTTNRNYLQEVDFLNFEIPLPSLSEQEAIVNAYENKIQQAEQLEKQAEQLEIEIENYLFSELGIEKPPPKKEKIKGLQFVQFKDLEKWGVDFVFQNKKNDLRYHTYKISDLCKISSGGTPSRNRKEYFEGNIPWIKTGELNNNILYDTEEKITNEAIQNSSAKLYKKGSLVMAMYGATIGKTAKLGVDATTNQACAVLFEINEKLVKVDFLWEFLQSQIHHFKAVAYGSAQPNLNAGIISNYQTPIPSLEKQQEIVDYISALKMQIKEKKNMAEQLKHQAQTDFENQIFN